MSERTQKMNWYKNWESARNKEHVFKDLKDLECARFWANVALAIEIGFSNHFGESFGIFLETL